MVIGRGLQGHINFYYCRYELNMPEFVGVYKDILISTIVDQNQIKVLIFVYKDILISTIVDFDPPHLKNLGFTRTY